MNSKNEITFKEFDDIINPNWKLYIDTCFAYATNDFGEKFWDPFEKVLMKNNNRLIMTCAMYNEYKKHKHHYKNLHETAQLVDNKFKDLLDKKLIAKIGNKDVDFNDNETRVWVTKACLLYNQIVFTNDLKLAKDLYFDFNYSSSVNTDKKLLIYKLNYDGNLQEHWQIQYLEEMNPKQINEYFKIYDSKPARHDFDSYEEYKKACLENSKQRMKCLAKYSSFQYIDKRQKGKQQPKTNKNKTNKKLNARLNKAFIVPQTGDTVLAENNNECINVTLGKQISVGGEGMVYAVKEHDDKCLKIYKKSKVFKSLEKAKDRLNKLIYIIENRLSEKSHTMNSKKYKLGDFVKFPTHILKTQDGEFIGYLMDKADGIQVSELISDASVRPVFESKYPDYTKKDLIDICLEFLKVVDGLHTNNIIVGDMNSANILLNVDSRKVFFIDADSYQYGNKFPCDVGVAQYTAPEFLKDHSSKFRTVQNELFVVARILCEILMPIDNPYKSTVQEDPITDMYNGVFRFTFDFLKGDGSRLTNKEAPDEMLKIRWGQFTREMKDTFGNTFHREGQYWEPGNRKDCKFWLTALNNYKRDIDNSIRDKDNAVSNSVYPTHPRKFMQVVNCVVCGKTGNQDCDKFKEIHNLDWDDINDLGKKYHFECYCKEHGLEKLTCHICGKECGYGNPNKIKYPICYECRTSEECPRCGKKHPSFRIERKQCETICEKCGQPYYTYIDLIEDDTKEKICHKCRELEYCDECGGKHYRWEIKEKIEHAKCMYCGKKGDKLVTHASFNYACRDCLKDEKCNDCGRKIKKYQYDKNQGYCDRCSKKKTLICENCGTRYRGIPAGTGKHNYCQSCWEPATCKKCGKRLTRNGNNLTKWMLSKHGLCLKCEEERKKQEAYKKTIEDNTPVKPVETNKQTNKGIIGTFLDNFLNG